MLPLEGVFPITTTTALLAGAFLNTLGLNTHIDYTTGPYANTTAAISAIKYLGVRNLRDCPESTRSYTIWPKIVSGTGAKFIAYMPRSSPTAMQDSLNRIPTLANAGVLNYIEGANEPDTAPALSAGNSLSWSRTFQQKVSSMGKTHGLKVINLSVGAGWTSADGWKGNYDSIGNLAAYADFANAHTYPVASTGMPYTTIDRINDLASLGAVGRPIITTEMGWNIAKVDSNAVASNLLNGIMDSAYLKDAKTYLFALYDDASGKWGLMNADGTARPAGKALHNLTTMLADSSTSFSPGSLTYTITGLKGTEKTLVFAKSDGSKWLAIWDEKSAAHSLTVALSTTAPQLQVYTPKTSSAAVQTASNVKSVSVKLGDSPTFIKVVPGASVMAAAAEAPAAVPISSNDLITSKASDTTITATSTTTSIIASGTGNTINAGPATTMIQAFAGGSTINGSSGDATVYIGNSGNKINVGTGTTTIRDGGTNNVITFKDVGGGKTDIYGYIFDQGTKLNLSAVMDKTEWDGKPETLGDYLKVTVSGSTATISVVPSGAEDGVNYEIAALHDQASLTLAKVVSNSTL